MSKMSEEELGNILNQYWEERKQAGIVGTKHAAAHRKAKKLISSYTQEKELEARMDENRKVVAMIESLPHGKPSPYFEKRITELQAQLNKSKGE